MASTPSKPSVPAPDPDKRKIATVNFVKARQMIDAGNFDYGISLLKVCCLLDAANLEYRRTLRKAQKSKYKNNMKGSTFAFFSTAKFKTRLKTAKASREYLKVLEYGEEIFSKNPWDLSTTMDMAEAFEALGLPQLALFTYDQTREKHPKNATLNRAMARIAEKLGMYDHAANLWSIVLQSNKNDVEAQTKANDLAANKTIAQGGYMKNAMEGTGGNPGAAAAGSKSHAAVGGSGVETQTDKLAREEGLLRKRLEADPTEPSLYIQLAALFRKYGDEDRARAVLQQGLGPTGDSFRLKLELLELELPPIRKSLEAAEAKYKKSKATKGGEVDGQSEEQITAAYSKLVKDVHERETQILRIKVENFPNDLSHRLELGKQLIKGNEIDEAVTVLQKVKQDERLRGKAAMWLGAAFLKKGKSGWPLAQRNFEDALSNIAESDEATRKETLYQFANGCARNGDLDRALELGQELANLDFGYRNISQLLDDWHAKTEKK